MWPFLLQDGDQYQVELVEKSSIRLEILLRVGILNDEVDDKVANAYCSDQSAVVVVISNLSYPCTDLLVELSILSLPRYQELANRELAGVSTSSYWRSVLTYTSTVHLWPLKGFCRRSAMSRDSL